MLIWNISTACLFSNSYSLAIFPFSKVQVALQISVSRISVEQTLANVKLKLQNKVCVFHCRYGKHQNSMSQLCNANFGISGINDSPTCNLSFIEMPGLILLRKRNANDRPLEGAKIVGCTHVTAQSSVSTHAVFTL
jgi:hypothetical protein